jgi:hypothetical protein
MITPAFSRRRLQLLAAMLACLVSGAVPAEEDQYRPVDPRYQEFLPVVERTLQVAPADWMQMKLTYSFYDSLGRTYVYARGASAQWQEVGQVVDFFPVHDFFDAYRGRTHPGMAKPWTLIKVVITRATKQYEVSSCSVTPTQDDIKLTEESIGC